MILGNQIENIKSRRFSTKHKITYEISHAERKLMEGGWKFARTTNHPFNTHLSFNFKTDPRAPEDDVKMVRAVAHQLRMWFQHKKVQSHIVWTRFVAFKNNTEEVDLLVHIPECHSDNFKKNVEGWNFGINVEPATYETDHFFSGKACTIFDLMFKATSNQTRVLEPDSPFQASAAMKGSRCFSSVKLGIPARRSHRAEARSKMIDLTATSMN